MAEFEVTLPVHGVVYMTVEAEAIELALIGRVVRRGEFWTGERSLRQSI